MVDLVDRLSELHQNKAPKGWEVDRKIPLALIGVLLSQTFFFGWFLSNHESRIEALEEKNGDVVTLMSGITDKMNTITSNAGETKVHLQYLSASLQEIEKLLKERNSK